MKAAAVTLAFLAAPAFALASGRPGEGFRILRRAEIPDGTCIQVVGTTRLKCEKERNKGGSEDCYLVGQDAGIKCLVDSRKVPETSDAVHMQCQAEAVKSSKVCYTKGSQTRWRLCSKVGVKAYNDCVKKDKVTTTSGQSQSPAIWDDFCSQAYDDAISKALADMNGSWTTRFNPSAGQDASLECLVKYSKVPEASGAVYMQCRAEAFKGARDCIEKGKTPWKICFNEQSKAYPDCVKKNKVTTTSGQSQSPAVTASTVASTSTQSSSGVAQPPAKVQAPQDPPRDPAQVIEDKLCIPKKAPNGFDDMQSWNKWGLNEGACRRTIAQCVFEEQKKNPKVKNFDGVIECMDKRQRSKDFDYGF
ncbi:uncharacterized protein G6M90_00g080340 [Metarhizium brunneum]|uniref:Uncharacterized protein n=1 Tax=Metarhizium brunneum TaxID=500148 RepID=A0A7D5UYH0_9HYPO